MAIDNPIVGMRTAYKRSYILDVTALIGKTSGVGPRYGDKKISIVVGKERDGNVFTFMPSTPRTET